MTGSDLSIPNAPTQCLDPLCVLEHHLESVKPQDRSVERNVDRQDEILRVADFLFGKTLNGALALLEPPSKPSLSAPSVSPTQPTTSCITRITSLPSQRTMYFVEGSSGGRQSPQADYLCMANNDQDGLLYCSCRAFWEKTKAASSNKVVCKHLLAIKLLPALGIKESVVEAVSDEEFSKLVLSRMAIDS